MTIDFYVITQRKMKVKVWYWIIKKCLKKNSTQQNIEIVSDMIDCCKKANCSDQ